MDRMHHGHEMMRRPSSGHEAALRSVQKPPAHPSMDRMHHGHEMMRRPSSGHEAALRSVQKPPAKPWRGLEAPAPTPPRMYRVEPREFRDLVQRLTGCATVAPTQPVAVRAGEGAAAAGQMYVAAPWGSFPVMTPPAVHPCLDGHQLI